MEKTYKVNNSVTITLECPATWDGWQCFPRSPVGSVRATCPNYIDGFQGVEEQEGTIDAPLFIREQQLFAILRFSQNVAIKTKENVMFHDKYE